MDVLKKIRDDDLQSPLKWYVAGGIRQTLSSYEATNPAEALAGALIGAAMLSFPDVEPSEPFEVRCADFMAAARQAYADAEALRTGNAV